MNLLTRCYEIDFLMPNDSWFHCSSFMAEVIPILSGSLESYGSRLIYHLIYLYLVPRALLMTESTYAPDDIEVSSLTCVDFGYFLPCANTFF